MENTLDSYFSKIIETQNILDEQNIFNKPTRYIKDIQNLKSLIPTDIYELLDNKIKDIKIEGIPNYKEDKALYKNMKIVYDDFTFNIEFDETMRYYCRLLIYIESPFEIGFDKIDDKEEYDYIIKKKIDVFYNEFSVRFNHIIIKVLNNIKEGCNKELDNIIRFDLGTGIGKYDFENKPYNLLEKKIISNENILQSKNLFGNGYFYVSFNKDVNNEIPQFYLKQLEIEEDVIKSHYIMVRYNNATCGEHISTENPYLEQTLNIMNKLADISKNEDIRISLNTKVSSVDIIPEDDDNEVTTLKDLMESKKIDLEDFNFFHRIVNNTKDFYQKEIKGCILSKKTRKKYTFYPYIVSINISERLQDADSDIGNRTKGGKKTEILFNKK